MARLVFLGSPAESARLLGLIVETGHKVLAVATRPPARRGRRQAPSPTPVEEEARRLGIEVTYEPAELASAPVDLGVVYAYGRILRAPLLGAYPLLNLHLSLLPRWRGPAPVAWTILSGDQEAGASVIEVVEELDAGPLVDQACVALRGDEYLSELQERLFLVGRDLLLGALAQASWDSRSQEGEVSWAPKLRREDLELRFSESTERLWRLVRLERAWTWWNGEPLGVLRARPRLDLEPPGPPGFIRNNLVATGDGVLELLVVKPASRAAMDARSWANGALRGQVGLMGRS